MTVILQWSRDALEDFKQQLRYIADRNPEAARHVADRVNACAIKLTIRSTGRPGRVAGTFEKPVPGLPYILAYTISSAEPGSTITIVRLIHTSRDWPKGSWPKGR